MYVDAYIFTFLQAHIEVCVCVCICLETGWFGVNVGVSFQLAILGAWKYTVIIDLMIVS